MNARPTIPVAPWQVPDPTGDDWDSTPPESAIAAARQAAQRRDRLSSGRPKPAAVLAGRVFQGRLNASDLDYMAQAILQMADENHELRERIRRLEERVGNG